MKPVITNNILIKDNNIKQNRNNNIIIKSPTINNNKRVSITNIEVNNHKDEACSTSSIKLPSFKQRKVNKDMMEDFIKKR